MPTLRVTILAELDGQPIFDTPLVRTITTDRVQHFDTAIATPSLPLPIDQLATLKALLFRVGDQPLTLQISSAVGALPAINPGGLLLILDGDCVGNGGGVPAPTAVVFNLVESSPAAEFAGVALGS